MSHHLVELVLDLGAFAQRIRSTARAMMEDALARVAEEDGLPIGEA